MQLSELLTEHNAIIFVLLFSRMSGLMAFFPFFSHASIPNTVKSAIAFYLTIFFFPQADIPIAIDSGIQLLLMVMMEFALGFVAALALNLIFGALGLAGMQISMIMGFSMATAFDPSLQSNSPIISNFLTLLAILILLAFNGHHLILLFMGQSIDHIALGGFFPDQHIWTYFANAVGHMFVLGFVIAFPIIALSILSDVIFGMLMKTMPQFNLLVVGFPIKIFLSVMVIVAVLGAMMGIFKREFIDVFHFLKTLYL